MALPMLNIAQPQYQQQSRDMLWQQAQGRAPSSAMQQAGVAGDRILAQQLGMARSGRGNQALQMRNAMDAGSQAQAQMQMQAQAQEAEERRRALAMMLQQQGQQQQQNNLQTGGMMNALSGGLGQAAAGGGLASMLAPLGMLALSDERRKRDIRDADEDASAFLRMLAPKAYRYEDEKPGSERLGILAQDVERARPELVKETPIGKAIDVPQATGALLAAAAHLNRRVERLEGGKAA